MAAATLPGLPFEVLSLILGDPVLETPDFINIALCCRTLYEAALSFSVRTLSISPKLTFAPVTRSALAGIFVRNPHLVSDVHTLVIIDSQSLHSDPTSNWVHLLTYLENYINFGLAPRFLFLQTSICVHGLHRCTRVGITGLDYINSLFWSAHYFMQQLAKLSLSNVVTALARDLLYHATNVRDLCLCNVQCFCEPHVIGKMGPPHLTRLELVDVNNPNLSNALLEQYSSNLEEFDARFYQLIPTRIVSLAKLSKLWLDHLRSHATATILITRCGANLRHLEISLSASDNIRWDKIADHIIKHATCLQVFRLADDPENLAVDDHGLWADCISKMKSLQILKLGNWHHDSDQQIIPNLPPSIRTVEVAVVHPRGILKMLDSLKQNIFRLSDLERFRMLQVVEAHRVYEFVDHDNWQDFYGIAQNEALDRITIEIVWNSGTIYRREGRC